MWPSKSANNATVEPPANSVGGITVVLPSFSSLELAVPGVVAPRAYPLRSRQAQVAG
jgi:hypothetical protein